MISLEVGEGEERMIVEEEVVVLEEEELEARRAW